jgi:hypothetical protein
LEPTDRLLDKPSRSKKIRSDDSRKKNTFLVITFSRPDSQSSPGPRRFEDWLGTSGTGTYPRRHLTI